jgi:hypothetical protein
MTIPHWLIGIVILGMAAVFVIFAFGQGMTVKPDRNKRHEPTTGRDLRRNLGTEMG